MSLTGGGGSGATVIAKVSPYHIYGGEITISGKTVGAYEESYLIDLEDFSERLQEAGLSAASYPITVRVSRLTEDSEAATVQDTLQVSTYTEIQPYNLTYADSALVGLVVDAQKGGGNIPRRAFDVKGKRVRVPTGYLADVEFATPRTYPDFWDGTFETKWSNNPAWILLDILNNERYGLGLEDSDIDVYALYEISKYCDELVPIKTINSEGVTEEDEEYRYTCNAVINSRREAYQVLQAIASTFRGMVYASANGVGFSQDRPKDPARLVSPADVIDGSFTYSSTARKARHSCALITWNDPDDNYKQAVEVYEDLDLIDRYGYNPIEVVAYGTTSQTQARRLGKWILDSEKNETDTITFQGGLDFLDISPGEIIAVADPMKQNARLGGRIMSHDFLTLTPSATADETIASAGTIAHGDMTLTSDAVFEWGITLDENINRPAASGKWATVRRVRTSGLTTTAIWSPVLGMAGLIFLETQTSLPDWSFRIQSCPQGETSSCWWALKSALQVRRGVSVSGRTASSSAKRLPATDRVCLRAGPQPVTASTGEPLVRPTLFSARPATTTKTQT